MKQERGTVIRLSGTKATLEMEDGSARIVGVPELIHIEVGMPVTVFDVGDGKPIFRWGD